MLFVGRLVREKGVETLLDAAPAVLAAHPEAKFVVAGGGGMREELMA
ncbi:MAG: glycosyltransferase, partial [Gemmatimonadales bacterium]|nr:glycosyltransferase [Gemmatimonadales bacterium]